MASRSLLDWRAGKAPDPPGHCAPLAVSIKVTVKVPFLKASELLAPAAVKRSPEEERSGGGGDKAVLFEHLPPARSIACDR